MPLTRARKEDLVAEYADLIRNSRAVIFTEYRGLTNKELNSLRNAVRDANGVYHIAKLSLFKLALEETGYPVPDILSGAPLAVGFCLEEVPAVAKALTEFADDAAELVLRGGLMGDTTLTAQQLEVLADLPPLETLRAQLAGLLDAPAANLVGVLQAGIAQVINVVNAYAESGESAEAAA